MWVVVLRLTGASTPRFGHVVFDLDGTLVDSTTDLARSVNHVLASLGQRALPEAVIAGFVGDGARMLLTRALARVGDDRVDLALATFMQFYGAHLLDTTRLYPGIETLLATLHASGVRLSVLSNKPEAMSRAILDGLGVLGRFVVVAGGDTFPTRKSDPAGALVVVARVGASVDDTLMVGDSVVDARTAAAAGIAFCGVTWGIGAADLPRSGDALCIASPEALLPIVNGGDFNPM